MKTATPLILLFVTSLAIGQNSDVLSTEACKANATPALVRLAVSTVYDGPVTARDGTTVAMFRDQVDARALSCVTNPDVPAKVQQIWAKALAEVVRRRHQMDMDEMTK